MFVLQMRTNLTRRGYGPKGFKVGAGGAPGTRELGKEYWARASFGGLRAAFHYNGSDPALNPLEASACWHGG